MGTATLILGKAFRGFDRATLGCFEAFSVATGDDVRVRFEVCPVCAVALPQMLAGSWVCLDRLSVRGGVDFLTTA